MTDKKETTQPACGARASLIVTLTPSGTATNVARERLSLRCTLPKGHPGAHVDPQHAERWEAPADATPTLLRHEED